MNDFRFRFKIEFVHFPPYIGSCEYDTRHECSKACLDLIETIKVKCPEVYASYKRWKMHGHIAGEPEPEWN